MKRLDLTTLVALLAFSSLSANDMLPPYEGQVAEQLAHLQSDIAEVRAGAAEALGFLRAYEARAALVERLRDASPLVRREAAMALAWCGDRRTVSPLIEVLSDDDWVTRQAVVHVQPHRLGIGSCQDMYCIAC